MPFKESIINEDGSVIHLRLDNVKDAKAFVIFAHGAGANMSHEFMNEFTQRLNEVGLSVLRFNFPFMDKRAQTGKKYPPDRMPKLLTCYHTVIDYVVTTQVHDQLPLFIGGKSMGSRVAAQLMADTDLLKKSLANLISGVFCVGYPFHPAKKPEKLRLEPIFEGSHPIIIVQGERDTLGSKSEIMTYELPDYCQCLFLDDGDHSLKPRVKSGVTYQGNMDRAVKAIAKFIDTESLVKAQ